MPGRVRAPLKAGLDPEGERMREDEMRQVWRDYADGKISAEAAQNLAEKAADARRGGPGRAGPAEPRSPPRRQRRAGARRDKVFGPGRGRPIDRSEHANANPMSRACHAAATHPDQGRRRRASIAAVRFPQPGRRAVLPRRRARNIKGLRGVLGGEPLPIAAARATPRCRTPLGPVRL
jgi:hypothetical protein